MNTVRSTCSPVATNAGRQFLLIWWFVCPYRKNFGLPPKVLRYVYPYL